MSMNKDRDLTFATINAFNLQLADQPTYNAGRPAFASNAAYRRRIEWLAATVRRLDADVIAFQEIWSARALEDVFREARKLTAYRLLVRDSPGLGQPQVALAIRRPWTVDHHEWIENFPPSFRLQNLKERHGAAETIDVSISAWSRPILKAQISLDVSRRRPPPVTLYSTHFKSKAPARLASAQGQSQVLAQHGSIARSAVSHLRRIVEAGALRAVLDEHMRSEDELALSPTVVLGDLNDATHSVSSELLSAQPGYRLTASSRAGSRADRGLYSVETLQQYRSQRHVFYTYIFRNRHETLDHVMVSEEFYDHSKKRHWSFDEMEIYNDHLAISNESRRERQRLLDESGAVDHGIVRARFVWDPLADDIRRIARSMENEDSGRNEPEETV